MKLHDALGRVPADALQNMGDLMNHHVREKFAGGFLKLHPVPEYLDMVAFEWERVSPCVWQKLGWSPVNEFNNDRRIFRRQSPNSCQFRVTPIPANICEARPSACALTMNGTTASLCK